MRGIATVVANAAAAKTNTSNTNNKNNCKSSSGLTRNQRLPSGIILEICSKIVFVVEKERIFP